MNHSATLGLRERKRAKTAEAIHLAAVELVLERGLDAATIDAISERADVSTRTFFNYFPSKEDAVLGIDDAAVSTALAAAPDAPDDLLAALFDLLSTLFDTHGGTGHKPQLMHEVTAKHPQLMTRHMARVTALEGTLSRIIEKWLATDARFAADHDADRLEQAQIILAMCLGTARVSMRNWAAESSHDPQAHADPAVSRRKTYERSITTLRTVLERLP